MEWGWKILERGRGWGLGLGVMLDIWKGRGKVYGSLRRLPLITLGVWRLPFDEFIIA